MLKFGTKCSRMISAAVVVWSGFCLSAYAGNSLKKMSHQELTQLLKGVDTQNIKVISVDELKVLVPDMAQMLAKTYPEQKGGQVLVLRNRAYNGADITAMVFFPLCSAVSLAVGVFSLLAHEWAVGAVLIVVAGFFAAGTYFVIVPQAL